MKNGLHILDEQRLSGYVFRVAEFERGCCKRSLSARLELCDRSCFEISFYGPHPFGLSDAQAKRKPMQAIPLDYAELAIEAMRHAAVLQGRAEQ